MEEKIYFGELPLDMSYTLTNLGICYRKKGDFEKARAVYDRAMKIKVSALGWYHMDIAVGLMNNANFHRDVGELDKAVDCLKQAIDIYEKLDCVDTKPAVMAMENLCLSALNQGSTEKMRAAEPYFWRVYETLVARDELDQCLPSVQLNYLQMFMSDKALDKVRKLSESFILEPKLANPLVYCYLAFLDHEDPSVRRTEPRPYEQTLGCCLDRYPQVEYVAQTKIKYELIPGKDLDGIMRVLGRYYEASGSKEYRAIVVAADTAQDTWPDGQLLIQQRGLEILPHTVAILSNLGLLYNARGEVSRAIECFEEVIEYDPENCHVMDALMVIYIGAGNVDRASHYLAVLQEKFSHEESIKEKFPRYENAIDKLKGEAGDKEHV